MHNYPPSLLRAVVKSIYGVSQKNPENLCDVEHNVMQVICDLQHKVLNVRFIPLEMSDPYATLLGIEG